MKRLWPPRRVVEEQEAAEDVRPNRAARRCLLRMYKVRQDQTRPTKPSLADRRTRKPKGQKPAHLRSPQRARNVPQRAAEVAFQEVRQGESS